MTTFRHLFINLHFHPFLFITFSLILGIFWQSGACPFLACLLLVVLTIVACLTIAPVYKKALFIPLILGFYALGAFRFFMIKRRITSFYETTQEKKFDILGTITDIETVEHPLCRQRLTIAAQKMRTTDRNGRWKPCNISIHIYTRPQCVMVADMIAIKDVAFKKPSNNSFQDYLLKEGVTATLFITDLTYSLIHHPLFSWSRWLFSTRKLLYEKIQKKMRTKNFHLFSSIFLGSKPHPKHLFEQTKDHFNTWGVTHYLARSGLHMVIFVFIWQMLFNFLPFYFMYKQILLVFLSVIYCLLSWPSVSFNRALLSFLLYKMCTLFRVATNFLHILSIVCFVILVHNPLQLFFLDFQLSFGLTFALALFAQLQAAQSQNH